jgi:hypothetical protein
MAAREGLATKRQINAAIIGNYDLSAEGETVVRSDVLFFRPVRPTAIRAC